MDSAEKKFAIWVCAQDEDITCGCGVFLVLNNKIIMVLLSNKIIIAQIC